jgi:hypothetical protein
MGCDLDFSTVYNNTFATMVWTYLPDILHPILQFFQVYFIIIEDHKFSKWYIHSFWSLLVKIFHFKYNVFGFCYPHLWGNIFRYSSWCVWLLAWLICWYIILNINLDSNSNLSFSLLLNSLDLKMCCRILSSIGILMGSNAPDLCLYCSKHLTIAPSTIS